MQIWAQAGVDWPRCKQRRAELGGFVLEKCGVTQRGCLLHEACCQSLMFFPCFRKYSCLAVRDSCQFVLYLGGKWLAEQFLFCFLTAVSEIKLLFPLFWEESLLRPAPDCLLKVGLPSNLNGISVLCNVQLQIRRIIYFIPLQI